MDMEAGKEMPNLNGKWQNEITSISQGVNYLYDTKELADATVVVKGHPFKVHKLILASRSSEFLRLLLGPNAVDVIIVDKDSPVTIDGFQLFLHFIYKNLLKTTNKKLILEGYICAKYFKQGIMQIRCEEEIDMWTVSYDEIFYLLEMIDDVPLLRERCTYFILDNTWEIISSNSFKNASFKSLCIIVESWDLENIPALQCIECIMKWGANRHTSPVNYKLVREDIGPRVFDKLPFKALNLEELRSVVQMYPGFLNPVEVVDLMSQCNMGDALVLLA